MCFARHTREESPTPDAGEEQDYRVTSRPVMTPKAITGNAKSGNHFCKGGPTRTS
jgi:hypothetical protein